MPLPEGLLNPIPGDNPSGKSLRYDPVYDKIRESRREEDVLPQGDWSREVKKADFPLVIKLTTEALSTKSKDLQLAAWLTEAVMFRDHISGLREGLDLLRGFMETFWDTLYPEIDDGDLEFRAGPLAWVGSKLDGGVRRLPLTKSKLDYFKYQESRRVGYEADAVSEDKATARATAIAEKKCTAEEFDEAVKATGDAYYEKLAANLVAALESVQSLETLSDEKFGREAPNFANLRTALEELQDFVKQYHKPAEEVVEETTEAPAEETVDESAAPTASGAPAAKKNLVPPSPPIVTTLCSAWQSWLTFCATKAHSIRFLTFCCERCVGGNFALQAARSTQPSWKLHPRRSARSSRKCLWKAIGPESWKTRNWP